MRVRSSGNPYIASLNRFQEYNRTQGLADSEKDARAPAKYTGKSTDEEAATARLKTTSFGFRLGQFGFNFRTQDLEIDPDKARNQKAQTLARQQNEAFETEIDVAEVLASMHQEHALPEPQPFSQYGQAMREQQGLQAYAKSAHGFNPTFPRRGTLIGVA